MHLTKDHIDSILKQTDSKIEDFNNFIETGTYMGDTILSIHQYFKNNYTIEIKLSLYYGVTAESTKRKIENINFYFGDSAVLLKDILKEVNSKSIFYLDAHWSRGKTGRGSKDTPLLEELQLINKYHNFDSIVIIDDFQDFGTKNKYVNWEDITVDHVLDCFDAGKVVKSFSISDGKNNRYVVCLRKLDKEQQMDRNIVISGGVGFIGSNIVDKLVNLGYNVTVIDNLSTGKIEYLNPKAKFIKADICSSQILQIIRDLGKIDVIIHTAAKGRVQPSLKDPIEYHTNNVTGTLNLLEACRLNNIPKFIYSSSSSVYGDVEPMIETTIPQPTSPYALTKYLGELYCKIYSDLYGIKTVCLRYFNVYGDRGCDDLVLGIFAKQKLEAKPLTIYNDGEQRRDFTFVGDVVNANILSMKIGLENNHEIINIGNSDNRSILQIAKLFGGPIEFVGKREEPKSTKAVIGKAYTLLGWKPTKKIEDWFNEYLKK